MARWFVRKTAFQYIAFKKQKVVVFVVIGGGDAKRRNSRHCSVPNVNQSLVYVKLNASFFPQNHETTRLFRINRNRCRARLACSVVNTGENIAQKVERTKQYPRSCAELLQSSTKSNCLPLRQCVETGNKRVIVSVRCDFVIRINEQISIQISARKKRRIRSRLD